GLRDFHVTGVQTCALPILEAIGGPLAMNKILSGDYKRPSQLVPHYPEELEAIIVRALQKDPANRFKTAEDMRLALEAFLMNAGLDRNTVEEGTSRDTDHSS